jgi:hypothetical protein
MNASAPPGEARHWKFMIPREPRATCESESRVSWPGRFGTIHPPLWTMSGACSMSSHACPAASQVGDERGLLLGRQAVTGGRVVVDSDQIDLAGPCPGVDRHPGPDREMAVTRLRAALGGPEFVQTVVKRGYRLRVD